MVHQEIMSRLNSGNACGQFKPLSSLFVCKKYVEIKVYKICILLVLYVGATLDLLIVIEVDRTGTGRKKERVTGGRRRFHDEHRNLYLSPDVTTVMEGACNTHARHEK
jgi:hypothetical protein